MPKQNGLKSIPAAIIRATLHDPLLFARARKRIRCRIPGFYGSGVSLDDAGAATRNATLRVIVSEDKCAFIKVDIRRKKEKKEKGLFLKQKERLKGG